MYSRCSRYFKVPPTDRESDSTLEELLSGNTLAHQSSLPRWMLFVPVIFTSSFLILPVPQGAHWLIRMQVHTQASLSASTTVLSFVGTARAAAPCPLLLTAYMGTV